MNPEIVENRARNIAEAEHWEKNASKEQLATAEMIAKKAGVIDGNAGDIPCSEIEYNLVKYGYLAEDWDKID